MYVLSETVGYLVDFLQIIAGVVGAVLIGSRVRAPARTPGLLGCLLLAVSGAATALYRILLPRLVQADLPTEGLSVAVELAYGLPAAAGIALLARALLLATRWTPSYTQVPYPQHSYPQQPYAQQPYAQQPYAQQPYAQQAYAPGQHGPGSPALPISDQPQGRPSPPDGS